MAKQRIALIMGTVLCLIFIALAPWLAHGRMPWNHGCVVWVFDVGQGDSQFIDCPGGQVLIDGGPSGEIIEHLSGVMAPWDRTIDVVINTHPHADHVTGLLSVLERYEVGEVWVSGQSYHTQVFSLFNQQSASRQRLVQAGDAVSLGEHIVLDVLWPERSLEGEYLEDPNEGSVVTLLRVGDETVLFTGDIGVEQERTLIAEVKQVDVLKVGHQGSLTSSDPTFLQAIDPEVAIISVGENSYGHPHPVVLDRFNRLGIDVWRTDEDGSVRVDVF